MKILLSGYHNPHFMNSMAWRDKAVGYLGHELVSFDDRQFWIPGRIREKFSFLDQWDLERLNKQLLTLVEQKKPDACIIVGGQRVLPRTVSEIRRRGAWTALWTTDVPIDFENVLAAAPFYDHLFCAGSEAGDIFEARGHRHVTWVPFACDPHFHQRMEMSRQEKSFYGRDMVFIGSYYPNRARALEEVADFNLGVWGPHWQKLPRDSKLRGKAIDMKINYDQWVKIYNASKISIVIHYQDPKVPCHQASPKLFEAMACGCFVLTDRQKDAAKLFKDKEHLVFFENEIDMRQKARYYLDHEEERRRIAANGYAQVRSRHRYQDRIQQILDVFRGENHARLP